MPDVTVVGGGPAGTLSARLLASSGRDVTLIEDHHVSGTPVHCAGVVSGEVIENMGVKPEVEGIISAAEVVLPDSTSIFTRRRSPYAYVIDRSDFDVKLADAAEAAGVTMKYGIRYKNHQVTESGVTINTNSGSITSDLLVGADGQSSLVAASLGNNAARSYIRGAQADVEYRMDDQECMRLWLGRDVAPGFFAWMLPLGDKTRIGLGVGLEYGPPIEYLNRLLDKTGLAECRRLATYVGKIPIGGRRVSYADRTLLIGDAAGQVKPVSGGGLYPISKAAPLLNETINRAYSMNMFTSSALALYERSWKREIGKSINGGMRLRKYFDMLTDEELCQIGHLYAREDISELLSEIDVDDPSNVVRPILRCKGVKSTLLKIYLRHLL